MAKSTILLMLKIVFTHVASDYTKKPFTWEISSDPTELVWNTNMAAILIFLERQYGERDVM